LEEDDSITTTVAVSSPRGGIRKKVPLVLLTSPHMSSPLKDAMHSIFIRKEANQPPWWYNLGTDIRDDVISKLKKL
jgi:hypothetical protein